MKHDGLTDAVVSLDGCALVYGNRPGGGVDAGLGRGDIWRQPTGAGCAGFGGLCICGNTDLWFCGRGFFDWNGALVYGGGCRAGGNGVEIYRVPIAASCSEENTGTAGVAVPTVPAMGDRPACEVYPPHTCRAKIEKNCPKAAKTAKKEEKNLAKAGTDII